MTTWRKWLALLLALVLTLGTLAGCANDPGQGSTPGAETTMEHSGTEPSTPPEMQPAETESAELGWMDTVPEYTGVPLIQPDPDREYYINLANQDCDFYAGGLFTGASLTIISKREYPISEIGVSIEMQNAYQVEVRNMTDLYHQKIEENSNGNGFSDYHYMTMQGIDWRELGQMAVDNANIGLEQIKYSAGDAKFWELEGTKKQYSDDMETYREQFRAIPEEEIPSFYVYDVFISFEDVCPINGKQPKVYDETVEELEVQLGDQRIPVRFGQWRFHAQAPEELTSGSSDFQQSLMLKSGFGENPYHDGFHRVCGALELKVQRDMTITGVRSYGADIPMVGALVRLGTAGENGNLDSSGVNDFYWDLKIPLDISAGQMISMDLFLRDDRFQQYEMHCMLYLLVDYEQEGRSQTMTIPLDLWRNNPVWDTYLMAFEGIDLGEYYTCFYNPQYDDFVWRLPEEWKK